MTKKNIIIIGSGFGSLAAAALLAKDGHTVTVLEKNEQLGGRASVLKADGFTFDMGPSWYLMPEVFERYFAEFDKKPTDFFKLIPLEPQYRNYFADGTVYDVLKDPNTTIAYFESVEKGAGEKLKTYLKKAEQMYRISIDHFLYKNMDSFFDFWNPALLNLNLSMSMAKSMESYVYAQFKDAKLRQLLTYSLVFLGCSPKNAPAVFTQMAHVDFNQNVFYPEGGMSAVVNALVKLGKQYGVKYVLNEPVEELQILDKKIKTIKTKNHALVADIVVSNADYAHTESLFSEENSRSYSTEYWKKRTYSPSAFLMYLGVDGVVPEFLHHSFIFSQHYDQHYVEVFDQPKWPKEPSLYINKASATDRTVAPKGHENIMILVPIAINLSEDARSKEEYAEFILNLIKKRTGVDFQSKIVYQKLFSVSDFSQRYNSYGGNAFSGLANTFLQSTFFRQSNKHKKVKNLYFVGVNTQPGVGVPPAIISAHLLQKRLAKEL